MNAPRTPDPHGARSLDLARRQRRWRLDRPAAAVLLAASIAFAWLAPAWAKPPEPSEPVLDLPTQTAPTPTAPPEQPRPDIHGFWRTFLPLASSATTVIQADTSTDTYVLKEGDDLRILALELGRDVEVMACVTPSGLYPLDELRPGMTIHLPGPQYVCHTVQPGETLEQIAERYQVDARVMVETAWNDLESIDERLEPGRRLLILDGKRPDLQALRAAAEAAAAQQPLLTPTAAAPGPSPAAPTPAPSGDQTQPAEPIEPGQPGAVPPEWANVVYRYGTGHFIWPVVGEISQGYGSRHRAIDIATPIGTPVLAADNGVVVKAGYSDVGYGGRIIIDHNIDYITLYAHLSRSLVEEGDVVKQGQVIGFVGSTGNSTGPHLHFELRDFGYLIDPRTVLPPR